MATMDECLTALKGILGDLAANPAAAGLDRSLSCRLTDLDEVVARPAERRCGPRPARAARTGRRSRRPTSGSR